MTVGVALAVLSGAAHADYWTTTVNGIDVIAAGQAQDAQSLARNLIAFEQAFLMVTSLDPQKARLPTRIFSVSRKDYEAAFPSKAAIDAAGFFNSNGFANDMILGPAAYAGSGRHYRMQVVYHEYVHYLMRSHSPWRYPAWYEEGFAELFSTAAIRDESVFIGSLDRSRAHTLLHGPYMPAEKMLRLERHDPGFYGHSVAPSFYAQSWLLVHLISIERVHHPEAMDYLSKLLVGTPEPQAFAESFKFEYSVLDREMKRAIKGDRQMQGLRVPMRRPEEWTWPTRKLTDEEFNQLYLDAVLRNEGDPRHVEKRLQSMREARPDDENALRLLARALVRQERFDEADAIIGQLESRPNLLAPTWADIGDVLMETVFRRGSQTGGSAAARSERIHRARACYRRAIELDATDVGSPFKLAQTHLALPDAPAESKALIPGLIAAFERLPQSPVLVSTIAHLYRVHGERREGQRFALLWTELAATPQALQAAKQLLLSFDAE